MVPAGGDAAGKEELGDSPGLRHRHREMGQSLFFSLSLLPHVTRDNLLFLSQLESFEKLKVLGVGGSGIVYELLHKSNGKRFAMKEIEIKTQKMRDMAVREAEMLKDIMENIIHPNILHIEKVQLYPHFSANSCYLYEN